MNRKLLIFLVAILSVGLGFWIGTIKSAVDEKFNVINDVITSSHDPLSDSVAVAEAVSTFITAFNNFDWPTFRAAFDDDATMFHPQWENAKRIRGRKEIEATWLKIFSEFNDPNDTTTLDITPRDINIQIYGQTAVVTFQLGDGLKSLGRRTVVMIRRREGWKIAHIHASRLNGGE